MELRPHQERAVQMLRQSLQAGNKRPLLAAPCSFGKTITAAYILAEAAKKGKRGIFICDRIKLVQQSIEAFTHHGLDIGVMQGNHELKKYHAPIQIASIHTLARRDRIPEFDIAIVDECFPAGTMVDTPSGAKPIDSVRLGDIVYNACGVGQVMSTSVKKANCLVKVVLEDGTEIKCTANHPILTSKGWTKAGDLDVRQRVIRIEDMPNMWGGDEAEDCGWKGCSDGISMEQEGDLLKVLLKETGESYAQQREQGKNESHFEAYRSQAKNYWGQWSRANQGARDGAERPWGRLDSRVHSDNSNEGMEGKETAPSLQDRFGESKPDDSNRAGWVQPLQPISTRAGREEVRGVGSSRVASIEIEECGSDTLVYNIGVAGHPSYFVDGVLVHNCHTNYKSLIRMMETYNNVPFIGLSATPYSKGLGKYYDDLILPITPRQLLDQGYLCPIKYYGGAKANLKGVKTKALPTGGTDYDPKSLAKATETDDKLTGDIIKNWLHHAKGMQTIAFTPSITHSKELVRQFNEAGISAEHIDGYMPDHERQILFDAHDRGEFKILSCSRLLNTGYDAPKVQCLIDAFPTKSSIVLAQRWGRVQRIAEGKPYAVILDHAGNFSSHGPVEDIIPDSLDDGTARFNEKNQLKEKKEPKAKECPQCYQQFIGIRCACGYEIPIKQQLETTDEILVELSASQKRNKLDTKQHKEQFYSELMAYASIKGYSAGWAAHKYKERYSVWPNKIKHHAINSGISEETRKFITSQNIRNSKRRAA